MGMMALEKGYSQNVNRRRRLVASFFTRDFFHPPGPCAARGRASGRGGRGRRPRRSSPIRGARGSGRDRSTSPSGSNKSCPGCNACKSSGKRSIRVDCCEKERNPIGALKAPLYLSHGTERPLPRLRYIGRMSDLRLLWYFLKGRESRYWHE